MRKMTCLIPLVIAAAILCAGCGKKESTDKVIESAVSILKTVEPSGLDYEYTSTKLSGQTYVSEHAYNNYRNMIYTKETTKESKFLDASEGVLYTLRGSETFEKDPFYWEDLDVDYDAMSVKAFQSMMERIPSAESSKIQRNIYGDGTYDLLVLSWEDKKNIENTTSAASSSESAAEPVLSESSFESAEPVEMGSTDIGTTDSGVESTTESAAEPVMEEKREQKTYKDVLDGMPIVEVNIVISRDRTQIGAFGATFRTGHNELTSVLWNDVGATAQSYRYIKWHAGETVPSLEEQQEAVKKEMEERGISYILGGVS